MTNKKHSYANVLRWVADGEQVQREDDLIGWFDLPHSESVLREVIGGFHNPDSYRVKPATILINGHEVPEPLQKHPAELTTVYWPELDALGTTNRSEYYRESKRYRALFARGLLHLTREAAEQHAIALLSFTITEAEK